MKQTEMSGNRLFLLYAFPCAQAREIAGQITTDQFHQLERLVDDGGEPSVELLSACFPDAVQRFYAHARRNPFDSTPWTVEDVSSYWLNHREGDSPVVRAVVLNFNSAVTNVMNLATGEQFSVVNRYRLSYRVKSVLLIHIIPIEVRPEIVLEV